jgi:NAD(P)-dependent dehydrogenase (short-subunit alcohol dehydrogenase family)
VKELKGKVAVITGAASGIGRALARRFANEKMKVVLADVEQVPLDNTEKEMRDGGAHVLAVQADVARARDVERLARATLDEFEAVHLLVNNAGVSMIGPPVWETTNADWDWILGVNLRGVVHGLRIFVPIMLEQATPCHIVNTVSPAGLLALPALGVYNASKAGIVSVSETLHHELALRKAQIKVSVLCPGLVESGLLDAARNRPTALQNDPELEAHRRAAYGAEEREMREAMKTATASDEVADIVIDAIRTERLYIFTHPWVKEAIQLRWDNIVHDREPWLGSGYKEPAT